MSAVEADIVATIPFGQEPSYDITIAPELVDEEIVYVARHPELPGCTSHGATPEEAKESLGEAREMYLAALREADLPIPPPKAEPRVMVLVSYVQHRAQPGPEPPHISWRVKTYPA